MCGSRPLGGGGVRVRGVKGDCAKLWNPGLVNRRRVSQFPPILLHAQRSVCVSE